MQNIVMGGATAFYTFYNFFKKLLEVSDVEK